VSLLRLRDDKAFGSFIDFIGLGDLRETQRDPKQEHRFYLQYILTPTQTELLYQSVEDLIYAKGNSPLIEINHRQHIIKDDLRSIELHKMPLGWYILIPTQISIKNQLYKLAETGTEIRLKDVTFGGEFYVEPEFPNSHTTVAFLYNGVYKSILVNPYQLLDYSDIGEYGSVFINPTWTGNPRSEYLVFPLLLSPNLLSTLNYPQSFN